MIREKENIRINRENRELERERCTSYANSLKFFYLFGIVSIYLLLVARITSWILLLVSSYRIITGMHARVVAIDVDLVPETICIKHNHDCGDFNNPCSKWLTRWRSRISTESIEKTFIINTIGNKPSKQPTHICKEGNHYQYPCKTTNDNLLVFFILLLFVIVIETVYGGYLYRDDCTFTFKTIHGVPSYLVLVVFVVLYGVTLTFIKNIKDALGFIVDDIVMFFSIFNK